MFKLSGSFLPPPPGVQTPPLWGVEAHVTDTFEAAGARPAVTRETVVFEWPSAEDAVREYTQNFGPFVMARRALQPQGRWPEFRQAFTSLVDRFDEGDGGSARIGADYLLITVER